MAMFKQRLKAKKFLTVLRNLSVTLKAGIPLVQALKLLEKGEGKRHGFVTHLRLCVEKGMTLGGAMEASPWTFPPIATALVKAGELSGTLQENIAQVVEHLRKVLDLQRKIKGAMMYPMIVVVAVIVMGLVLGTFVLPQLIPLFESLDVELPLSTKLLLWASVFFRDYGAVFTPSALAFCVIFVWAVRTKPVQPLLHRFVLTVPLIKQIQVNSSIAQICATLGLLLKSGLPIAEAVPATAQATTNTVFRRAIFRILPSIQEGRTFAQGLRDSKKLFPEMMVLLIDVGETAGNLSETLEYVAAYHEEELDFAVKTLTVSIEPVLLVIIGIVVGIFVMAIITPIYNVTSSI